MTEACSWTRELWVAGRLWPSLQEELTVLPILGTARDLGSETTRTGVLPVIRGGLGSVVPSPVFR